MIKIEKIFSLTGLAVGRWCKYIYNKKFRVISCQQRGAPFLEFRIAICTRKRKTLAWAHGYGLPFAVRGWLVVILTVLKISRAVIDSEH